MTLLALKGVITRSLISVLLAPQGMIGAGFLGIGRRLPPVVVTLTSAAVRIKITGINFRHFMVWLSH
jgi:hypothetical protein